MIGVQILRWTQIYVYLGCNNAKVWKITKLWYTDDASFQLHGLLKDCRYGTPEVIEDKK